MLCSMRWIRCEPSTLQQHMAPQLQQKEQLAPLQKLHLPSRGAGIVRKSEQ